MKIEIEIPTGCKAEWVNGVLTLVQEKKDLRTVTERVKTFEDACNELGKDHPLCVHFREMYDNFLFEGGDAVADIVAYLKLRIITAALNESWTPHFTGGESRYYPWFELYNEDDWNDLSEDFKRERGILFLGGCIYGAVVNSVSDFARSAPPCSDAFFASRLCFKTAELALYAGKQFIGIWADFCLICR